MEIINTIIYEGVGTNGDGVTKVPEEELASVLKQQELEEKMLDWSIDSFWEYIMLYRTKYKDWELCISLPNKWEFEWFNFKCKIRDLRLFLNEETSEDTKLGEEIANLLYKLENYLKAYWIEADEYKVQDCILNPIFKKYHIWDKFTETDEEV